MNGYEALEAHFGTALRHDEPLARHTAARLGGPADVLLVADMAELVSAVQIVWDYGLPYRILGGGTNVLAADEGFRGVVIVNRANEIELGSNGVVGAQSGANLSGLARICMSSGLAGLQWAVSVPGTLGGAVINNAGAFGSDMAANVISVAVLRPTGGVLLTPADLAYGYRTSSLKHSRDPYLVTGVTLQLQPGADPDALRAEADGYAARRKQTQPPGASLGSIFKNPPGDYAGRLIEAAGLKGTQIGGVQISPVHANFFVHVGQGTAADYLALIRLAQTTIAERFGIQLELEIQII